jgi:hypothetical protein
LCGKWLLHGFKIAKLNLQGNPRLMQRSQLFILVELFSQKEGRAARPFPDL